MIDLHPHRLWIALLALAALIGVGSGPLIGAELTAARHKLSVLQERQSKTAAALRQLRDDIAATELIKTRIDMADAEATLAPADRLRVAQSIERRAAQSRLTRLTYTLSPEQKTDIDTVGAGAQTLATSRLTLAAEAPTDIDAYIFLDALRQALPGRLTLRHITMERIGTSDAAIAAANLRLTAEADWLSNGAAQNLAEEQR